MRDTATNVIVLDDHPLFRVGLRLTLKALDSSLVVVEADSFDTLKATVTAHPDAALVLLDLLIPGVRGMSALRYLHDEWPQLRVAIVTALTLGAWLDAAQDLGAVGFIHKSASPEYLRTALGELLAGGEWWMAPVAQTMPGRGTALCLERLSEREKRILSYVQAGHANRKIAEALDVSEATVKARISAILKKLDLSSRTQAAVLAQRLFRGKDY